MRGYRIKDDLTLYKNYQNFSVITRYQIYFALSYNLELKHKIYNLLILHIYNAKSFHNTRLSGQI